MKLGQPHQVVGKLYRGGIHVQRKEGWIAKDFKAGYVDPRETQISGVGQDFRKAQLLVAVYSGVCVACQAAETVKPESKLVDDSRRGDVRPAYAQILAAVGDDIPESGQVALPALYGEAERIVLIHIVDGVVSGQVVVGTGLMVDADHKLIGLNTADGDETNVLEVVRSDPPLAAGKRLKAASPAGLRRNEGMAARAAGALRLRRNGGLTGYGLPQAEPFIGDKEERPISLERSAQRAAELVAIKARNFGAGARHRNGCTVGPVEEILGIEVSVANELESRPV